MGLSAQVVVPDTTSPVDDPFSDEMMDPDFFGEEALAKKKNDTLIVSTQQVRQDSVGNFVLIDAEGKELIVDSIGQVFRIDSN